MLCLRSLLKLSVARFVSSSMPEALDEAQLYAIEAFLLAGSQAAIENSWNEAEQALRRCYPSPAWVISKSENLYGAGAHRNLFQQEMPRDFRDWLTTQGIGEDEYAAGVGAVQYASAQMHLASVMPENRSNRGWRVRAIGFPALRLIAVGLASNYQGTQNQNAMGRASERIRDTAMSVLEERTRALLSTLPSATASDWDERGLMEVPVHSIGPIDISGYDDGAGARLRMVRNTTVKKEVATFFAIRGFTQTEFAQSAGQVFQDLRSIANELGRERV